MKNPSAKRLVGMEFQRSDFPNPSKVYPNKQMSPRSCDLALTAAGNLQNLLMIGMSLFVKRLPKERG